MGIYTNFAYVYDRLMAGMDYPEWVKYIEAIFQRYDTSPKAVVDLACGTGGITIPMARKGYEVIGIDRSEDMLYVAREKSRKLGLQIPFVCQDIRQLTLHRPVDAVTCMCDGFNYILSEEELSKAFQNIFDYLKPGGLFIFDISSYFKLSSILGNHTMADTGRDISFIWQNSFDKTEAICQMELTFFVRKGELYQRFDEVHYQKAYQRERILELLVQCGYDRVESYHPFTFEPPKKRAQRIFFAARKPVA